MEIPTHYLIELNSPPGDYVHSLNKGDTVWIDGEEYIIDLKKTKVKNDYRAFYFVQEVSGSKYKKIMQSCESFGENYTLAIWGMNPVKEK